MVACDCVGANASAGMDNVEFKKHIKTDILELFPDAADRPGRRVMVKIDGGPGRLHMETLACLCS